MATKRNTKKSVRSNKTKTVVKNVRVLTNKAVENTQGFLQGVVTTTCSLLSSPERVFRYTLYAVVGVVSYLTYTRYF